MCILELMLLSLCNYLSVSRELLTYLVCLPFMFFTRKKLSVLLP
jgi:hypothetical protein